MIMLKQNVFHLVFAHSEKNEKMKVYITQNVLTRKIEKLKEMNILIHKKSP